MTLADFSKMHGLKAVVRRHMVYSKPTLPVSGNMMCALIYSRTIDPAQLGLNLAGSAMATRQGELLAEMNLIPKSIISGIDLRNVEGAFLTAEAIKKAIDVKVPCHKSPTVTYPYYDATKALAAWDTFGDYAAHMYLAGRPEVEGLWTETRETFASRIISAVAAEYPGDGFVLFDLNYEQILLLHFLHVEKAHLDEIPHTKGAWEPKNGGGIAYGNDGMVMEFDSEFNMIIPIVP